MGTCKTGVVAACAQGRETPGIGITHVVKESSIPARAREDSDAAGQIALLQRQIAMAQAARIDADEAARQHLARELHDSVGAELAATHFALARVHASLSADASPQCTEALSLVAQSLNAAVEAVRHALDGLSAPHLDAGLVPVLADWARGFGARTGLATSFVFAADVRLARLSADAALAVFRVAQEALANVARHARATRADVRLDCAPRHLILTITDDGIGLPRGGSHARRASGGRKHYGLAGMRERCATFGGTLRAGGRGVQAGTAVRARFAWDALLGANASDTAPSLVEGAHS
ncbi:sensor histidine kinase [Paraburkholderia dinghuensis]|uniref:histidine kinase n=1 Tax=Paraburkholderia dinghuensis TaxID=2305225 RepID=A0A3N6N466_9BURK|nr:ATP-binding protein [Paraburkholderia dinghuensis]RQH03702.1 histidine kinase [Paraburkholderia dinghuensis]